MPSGAGNGSDASARKSGSMSSNGGASPLVSSAAVSVPVVSATDAWLVQKLKHEWSSCDLGPLLTKERLADVVASFPHLDTPIKVRLLLSFLSMRKEDFEASKFAVVEIVDAAEKDTEEWVKVGAGIVNQYLFMSRDGAESGTYHHEQLARASTAVLDAVRQQMDVTSSSNSTRDDSTAATRVVVIEDFFCHENAYLSASVRPELAVQPAAHFTIAADAPGHGTARHGGTSSSMTSSHGAAKTKPPMQRPQLARPLSHSGSSAGAAAASATSVPVRMASQASKPPALPPKKNMSELSSEIRRKADAGRFKRQRSRISVIDIDEVKQIESEKAQKAEEQKKRLKATKDDKKSGAGTGHGASGGDAANGHDGSGDARDKHGDGHGSDDDGALDGAHTQESHYSEHDDHHESDRDEAESTYHHGGLDEAHHRHRLSGNTITGAGGFAQDGPAALLHAAFHSTGDVMKEVVAQQHQPAAAYPHQQHDYYHHRQSRQSSTAALPPPQQQQQQQAWPSSRGFESDDAHAGAYGSNAYGYGAGGYGAQFGDHAAPYNDGHPYGATTNGGFADEQLTQQHQQQHQQEQQGGLSRYDSTRDRGFLDGPPEYWR